MTDADRNRINRLKKALKKMTLPERVRYLKILGYDAYGKDADLAKYLDIFDEKEPKNDNVKNDNI